MGSKRIYIKLSDSQEDLEIDPKMTPDQPEIPFVR